MSAVRCRQGKYTLDFCVDMLTSDFYLPPECISIGTGAETKGAGTGMDCRVGSESCCQASYEFEKLMVGKWRALPANWDIKDDVP